MSATASASIGLNIDRKTPGYWHATFHNPPINLLSADLILELVDFLDRAEQDPDLRVVVFDSADPDFFIAHLDLFGIFNPPEGKTPINLREIWPSLVSRLAHSPIISIVKLKGRARGVGNEFSLACDMRFASREKAIFAQPEIGWGAAPGGGGMDWLSQAVGRSRALEIVLSGLDYDADMAERYGWINRALPDAQIDAWVEDLALRIASFDQPSLLAIKRLINARVAPPSEASLTDSFVESSKLAVTPSAHERIGAMAAKGLGTVSEVELWTGDFLSPYGAQLSLRRDSTS